MGKEIELKLLGDATELGRLMDAPAVTLRSSGRARVRRLRSVYFDSADGTLEKAGVLFRIRNTGRRFVATVKRAPVAGAASFRRDEWEAPVEDMRADPAALLGLLPRRVRSLLENARLEPVFTTEVRRLTRRLVLPDAAVEIAFDQGFVEAGGRRAPISEIELELQRGGAAALYEIARDLADTAALRPSVSSKGERGYALARGRMPAAPRAPRLRLNAGVSLDAALSTILGAIFWHLLANQPAAEDGSLAEGVHQVRVALRRLRALLALIPASAPAPDLESLRRDARTLAAALAPVRNWDYFLGDVLPALRPLAPEPKGFQELAEAAGLRRAAAQERAREALLGAGCGRFELRLGGWIEARGWRTDADSEVLAAPALAFARPLLARRRRKVLKLGRHFRRLSPEARHALRLAVKKLRYPVDFFLSLETGKQSSRRFSRQLGRLQELLGRSNDLTTVPVTVAELADGGLSAAGKEALGFVLARQAETLARLEADLRVAWRAFR